MPFPSIQSSPPALAPDPALRRDIRRGTPRDQASLREAFTLPEPARDAPGMARRPEPTRAAPARAEPARPGPARPGPEHDDAPVARRRDPDTRATGKPDQRSAARRDAGPETEGKADTSKSAPASAGVDKARGQETSGPTDDGTAKGASGQDSAAATVTASADPDGARATVPPDAEKAAEETLAEGVLTDVGIAAAPVPTTVSMAMASPDISLTGDTVAGGASVAGVIAGAPAPMAADAAVEAGAVQSGAAAPVDPATLQTGRASGEVASALPVAGPGADAVHVAAKSAATAPANPAVTGDSPTQSSTTTASSAGLPSSQADTATSGQGSADGKARDGEDRTGAGPDGAQKSADGQGPRLDLPKSEMPKPDFLQRLEQTLAGLEGRPGHRPGDSTPAHAGEQRPSAETVRPTHPSAVPMEIGLRALQGAKEFQIRLDPAELGRIDVRLEIGDDKSVSARLVVDRVETLHLLQRDAKTLERALEQAGLKASDAGIDISLRDPGQQGRPDRGQREDDIPGPFGRNRGDRVESMETPPPAVRARSLRIGGLDLSI